MTDVSPEVTRPGKDEHFLNRARVVAERSTCLRRSIGAVIVMQGVELSSGYVGAPRGAVHCSELRSCLRMDLRILPGERYELCRSVHAEQNAIINAARIGIGIVGGTMYLWSQRVEGAYPHTRRHDRIYGPCLICKKEIINAGLEAVFVREEGVGTRKYTADDIRRLLAEEEAGWRARDGAGEDPAADT